MLDYDLNTGEILIYDEIGPAWWGLIDAASVMDIIKRMGSDTRLKVHLNTPGGDVDEGVAIFNAFKKHPGGVDTYVDSVAASIGSYLFLAGENRVIANNGKVMIHKPWTIAMGNSTDLRKTADVLDKYEKSKYSDYLEAMDCSEDELAELMEAETWYVGDEAVECGLATAVGLEIPEEVEPATIAAGRYKNTPKDLLVDVSAGSRRKVASRRIAARIRQRKITA